MMFIRKTLQINILVAAELKRGQEGRNRFKQCLMW